MYNRDVKHKVKYGQESKKKAGEKALKKALDFEEKDPLKSSFLMKEALGLFRDAEDSQSVKKCKRITRRINRAAQADLRTAKAQVSISKEELVAFISPFLLEDDPFKCLEKIAGEFVISYQRVRRIIDEAKKEFVFMQICNTTVLGEDDDIVKGGSESDYVHFMHQYQLNQGVIREYWMPRLFRELFKNNKLNFRMLMSYLNRRGIWDTNNFKLVEVGLRRYFARDYTAAMHILVPQFERFFLDISGKLGLDVITLIRREVATEGAKLSTSMLRKEEWRGTFGEDLCEQINFVFCDPLGYALRHKVAHGNISRKECNFNNCTLIIYFYIVLAAMIDTKEK